MLIEAEAGTYSLGFEVHYKKSGVTLVYVPVVTLTAIVNNFNLQMGTIPAQTAATSYQSISYMATDTLTAPVSVKVLNAPPGVTVQQLDSDTEVKYEYIFLTS